MLSWTAGSFRRVARRAKLAGNWYLAVKGTGRPSTEIRAMLHSGPIRRCLKRMRQPNPRSEAALYSVGGSRMQTAVLPMLAARRIGAW